MCFSIFHGRFFSPFHSLNRRGYRSFCIVMYGFLTVRAFSNALGVVEVAIAILIGLRHWSAKASALGSAGAVLMFLTTLSFLFSTPGWESSLGGFPSLSALPGQFLLKDVVLLGAALWSFGEAWTSSVRCRTVLKS